MNPIQLIYPDESYAIRGACFEVCKDKGCGFLESVYQESLELEFGLQGIEFVPQPRIQLEYKGRKLRSEFIPDFVCWGKIIVELKAVSALADEHRAQVHNYLKATGFKLGFLVNFGQAHGVKIERIVK